MFRITFNPQWYQHVGIVSKTVHPPLSTQLTDEYQVGTRREGCLFGAMMSPEKIVCKNDPICF